MHNFLAKNDWQVFQCSKRHQTFASAEKRYSRHLAGTGAQTRVNPLAGRFLVWLSR
jgi:hypothetical protein